MKVNFVFLISLTSDCSYDSYDSHVVIAKDELEARKLCKCADECVSWYEPNSRGNPGHEYVCVWLNPSKSTTKVIGISELESQLVLSSFNAG